MAVHRHVGGPVPDAVAGGREERAVRHEPRIDRRAGRDRHGEGTDADAAAWGQEVLPARARPLVHVRRAPVLGRGLAGPVRRIRDGEPVAIGRVGLPGAGVEGRGQRAEGRRVALGDGTGVGLGDAIGLGLGLAVDTTAPGPPMTPVDLGMAMATAPTATATAAAAPARTTNRDMCWPPRGQAEAGSRLGRRPDGSRDRATGRRRKLRRAIVQPGGDDDVRVSGRAHADWISAVSRVESIATDARRVCVA